MPTNTFNLSIAFNGHTIKSGESVSFQMVPGGSVTDADLATAFSTAVAAAAAGATGVTWNAGSQTLSFGPGAVSPFVVPFTVNTDATTEGDEIFAVTITNQSAGKIKQNSATVVFRDTSTTPVSTIALPSSPAINWLGNFSGGNIRENTPANTPLATLTATSSVAVSWAIAGTTAFRVDGQQLVLNRAVTFAGEASIPFVLTPSNVTGNGPNLNLTATILAAGSPPSSVSLSASTVPERSSVGTIVGTISGTDPDVGDTLTFSIVSGSDPGGIFQIVSGNSLRIASSNFTVNQGNRPVTIRATDTAGNIKDQPFTITVTDVNEAPTDITLTPANPSVPADSPVDFVVGSLTSTDPDPNQTFQYTFASSAPNFKIIGTQIRVATSPISPVGAASFSITSTDQGGLSVTKSLPYTVTPAATVGPSSITVTWRTGFTNGVVPDGTPVGTILADLAPNAASTLSIFSDTDNKFAVINTPTQSLVLNQTLNAATKASHNVTVRATNTGGSVDKPITVSVIASSASLQGTPDGNGNYTFVPFLLPTANNTGYRGTLQPYTNITTTSTGSNIYRSGTQIFMNGTAPTLSGYDCRGAQVYPQSPNWTITDCLFNAALDFRTIYVPNGTTYSGGKMLYCTLDGEKINNNNHGEMLFVEARIHTAQVSFCKIINIPADGITFGGSVGLITKNYCKGFGYRVGAHPDIITFNAGYTSQLESIIAYNYFDQTDASNAAIVAANSTIKWDDNADARSNYFVYRNLHRGSSIMHQINDVLTTNLEFSENYRYILNGPPIYGPLGVGDPSWDGPNSAFYGQVYTDTNTICIHDEIEARDGTVAYEPDPNQQRAVKGTVKVERFIPGRPGQVTINSITSGGAVNISIPTGSPTSYQWRTSIAGTGEFGGWATLTTSGSGPLTGTISLIASAYNHVLIRAVNANGPGPVSKTYEIASGLVTPTAPTIGSATISGTTVQGNTLTATANTVTGTPTPTLSYQWQRDVAGNGVWSNVGTNSSTYLLGSSDVGNKIRVIITASNGNLPNGTATSAATALITAPAATISRRSIGTIATSSISTASEALSCSPGLPAGIVAGDLLLLFIESAAADSITAMSGWTLVGYYTFFGNGGFACYKRTATGSDVSPTVAITGSRVGDRLIAAIAAYQGGSGLVDASEFEYYTSSASATSTGSNRLAIYGLGVENGATGTVAFTATAPTGYTKIIEQNTSASSYNPLLVVFEGNALVGSGAVTPATPTYSPSTPSTGGHGLILIY